MGKNGIVNNLWRCGQRLVVALCGLVGLVIPIEALAEAPAYAVQQNLEAMTSLATVVSQVGVGKLPVFNLTGNDWSGYLYLVDGKTERVYANIVQSGSYITISTTSTQSYGRNFTGTIDSDNDMYLYDSNTGEDWTTHFGPCGINRIELHDYVHNLTALDGLFLARPKR